MPYIIDVMDWTWIQAVVVSFAYTFFTAKSTHPTLLFLNTSFVFSPGISLNCSFIKDRRSFSRAILLYNLRT